MIKIKNEGFIGDMVFGGMEDKIKEMDKQIKQNEKEMRMLHNHNKKIFACDIKIINASLIPYSMRTYFPSKKVKQGWLQWKNTQYTHDVCQQGRTSELYYIEDGKVYSKSIAFQTKKNKEFAATKMSVVPILEIIVQKNLEGSYFEFGGCVFRIVSRNTAICTTSIGECGFVDIDRKVSDLTDYYESSVEQFINKWLIESLSGWKEQVEKDKKQKQQQEKEEKEKEKEFQKIQDYKKFLINKVRGMKLKEYENKQLLQMMNSKLYDMLTPEDRNMNSDLYIEELIKQTQTVDALNKLDETLDNFEKNRNNIQPQNDAPKKKRMKSNRCPNCGAIFSKQDWLNDDETIDCPACGDWFYKEDLMEFYKRNSKGKNLTEKNKEDFDFGF